MSERHDWFVAMEIGARGDDVAAIRYAGKGDVRRAIDSHREAEAKREWMQRRMKGTETSADKRNRRIE